MSTESIATRRRHLAESIARHRANADNDLQDSKREIAGALCDGRTMETVDVERVTRHQTKANLWAAVFHLAATIPTDLVSALNVVAAQERSRLESAFRRQDVADFIQEAARTGSIEWLNCHLVPSAALLEERS